MGAARARYFLGLASLSTGVALLVYFLAGISLGLSAAVTLLLAVGAACFLWRGLNPEGRREISRRARAGLLSGLLATLGYDTSRYVLVQVAGFSIWPFDTFRLFGRLLAGEAVSPFMTTLIGTTYHLVNGLGFALGYTLILGYKGWKAGIAWALGLEILMVTFYPGWLGLKALDEFLSVSILGHVTYGLILGWNSRRLLTRNETQERGGGMG